MPLKVSFFISICCNFSLFSFHSYPLYVRRRAPEVVVGSIPMRSFADRDTANYSLELVGVDRLIVKPHKITPGARLDIVVAEVSIRGMPCTIFVHCDERIFVAVGQVPKIPFAYNCLRSKARIPPFGHGTH